MQKHTITVEQPGQGKVTLVLCNTHISGMLKDTLPLDELIRFTLIPNDAPDAKCVHKNCPSNFPATAAALSLLTTGTEKKE
jgi:hypothetical protein